MSYDGNKLPLAYGEIYTVKGVYFILPGIINLFHIPYFYQGII